MPDSFDASEIEQMRWFTAQDLAEALPGVRAQALRALELLERSS